MSENSVVLKVIKEKMLKKVVSYPKTLSNMRLFYFYILDNGLLKELNEKQKEYNDFSCDVFANEIILIFSKLDAELEYSIFIPRPWEDSFGIKFRKEFVYNNTHSLPNGEETFVERHDEFLKELGYNEQTIEQTHLQNKIEVIKREEQRLLQQRQKYQIELGKLKAKE